MRVDRMVHDACGETLKGDDMKKLIELTVGVTTAFIVCFTILSVHAALAPKPSPLDAPQIVDETQGRCDPDGYATLDGIYAMRIVQRSLRLPETAIFDQRVCVARRGIVCGYVSARNLAGRNTGLSSFIVFGAMVAFADGSREFQDIWQRECGGI